MKRGRKTIPGRVLYSLLSGLLVLLMLLLYAGGIADPLALALQDRVCQQEQATSGAVTIVGIDDRAIDELGPYSTWGRGVMAQVIEKLNKSEDIRPAAIVLDVVYSGTSDPGADAALVEAAARYPNVIVASSVEFGMALNADRRLVTDSIVAQAEPFAALGQAAQVCNINAMLDTDGISRHHLLKLTLPDGRVRESMALMAANAYRAYWGEEPCREPQTKGLGFWYLPFTGTPGAFDEGISVADILAERIPAEYFAGRVVLIGATSAALQDNFFTAIDHAEPMYGVEIQANATEALLRGEFLSEASAVPQWIFLCACAALLVWYAGRGRLQRTLLLWLALTAGWILACFGLARCGLVLQVLWFPLCMTLLYAAAILYHAFRYFREKREVTNMFQHYVAPEVVNEILRTGPEALNLGGRVERIAVLFVDVRGFTTMSELLQPTEVVAILNEYLSLITDCVLRHHGTLDKFVGDAAMAIWGAPLPQEDYVWNAVQAARDMVKGSEELSEHLLEKYGRTVAFGIGVHVGEAVVGNMGSSIRMDYTAIGDTVNTSARLEANAPGGHVYISRQVADELGDRIRARSLGPIPLKGKKDGFEVLDLLPEEAENEA